MFSVEWHGTFDIEPLATADECLKKAAVMSKENIAKVTGDLVQLLKEIKEESANEACWARTQIEWLFSDLHTKLEISHSNFRKSSPVCATRQTLTCSD